MTDTGLDGKEPNPGDKKDWESGLLKLALKAMSRVCHSDTAMLQFRDVFFVPEFATVGLTDEGLEAVLDAIFWKGDYIQCMNVSGATVTSTLQTSKSFQQKQFYGLLATTSLDRDWSLVTLGTNEEQDDVTLRLIDSRLIDPKRLYSLGTTDFMANGDTGYDSLQGAEPPPDTPWRRTKLHLLTAAILDLKSQSEHAAEDLDALYRRDLIPPSQAYLPDSLFSKWLASTFTRVHAKPSVDALQEEIQTRPVWSFDIFKADFGYSMSAHSGYERSIPTLFPGVSAIDLTSQNTSSITFDYVARMQRDSGQNEIYAQSEMNFGYKKTRQAAKNTNSTGPVNPNPAPRAGDPYIRNQPADFVYHEAGYARHLSRAGVSDGWRLVFPLGLQTQLAPSITLPEGVSGPQGTFVIASPKSYYLEGRPGLRWSFSYPTPANWSMGQGGGGGGQSGGALGASGGGGGKGTKGKGSSSSSGSSGGQNGGNTPGVGGQGGTGGGPSSTLDSYVELAMSSDPLSVGPRATPSIARPRFRKQTASTRHFRDRRRHSWTSPT